MYQTTAMKFWAEGFNKFVCIYVFTNLFIFQNLFQSDGVSDFSFVFTNRQGDDVPNVNP